MSVNRFAALGMLLSLALGMTAKTSRADHFDRMERDICRLTENAQALVVEVNAQFRGLPQFACLSNESARVLSLANQVHAAVHRGSGPQIYRDLCEIERLAHHLHDEIDRADDFARNHQRVHREHRVDTRKAYRLAASIEDLADDLKQDVRDLPVRPAGSFYPSSPAPNTYYYPPRPAPVPTPAYRNPPAPVFNAPWGYERSTSVRPSIQFGTRNLSVAVGG